VFFYIRSLFHRRVERGRYQCACFIRNTCRSMPVSAITSRDAVTQRSCTLPPGGPGLFLRAPAGMRSWLVHFSSFQIHVTAGMRIWLVHCSSFQIHVMAGMRIWLVHFSSFQTHIMAYRKPCCNVGSKWM
jgi:hypothetical protein